MRAKIIPVVISIAIIFASCDKQGPTGPAGQNGAANVSMNSISVTTADWVVSNSTNWFYNTTLIIPSTDVCEIYVLIGGEGYTPLPTTTLNYLNGGQLYFYYQTGVDVQLRYYNSSAVLVGTTLDFNIVDIPPAIQVKHPNTNWKNPTEVALLPEVASILHN